MLNADEQRLFGRLAVFAGGWTIETAQAIADAGLDVLQSLVEKSLVRRTGERFWMLEMIREYALERLEASGDAESLRRRHAEWFLELSRSLGLCVESIEQGAPQRHDIAIAEQENFRAAIAWARDAELAVRLAVALENFWITHNPFEGRRLFEGLFELRDDLPLELRPIVTRCRGSSTLMTGEIELGRRLYEQSLELYKQLGDEFGIAHLMTRLATADLGDPARERRMLEEASSGSGH